MNLKHLFSRHTINIISKLNGRTVSPYPYLYENIYSATTAISPSISSPNNQESTPFQSPKHAKIIPSFTRYIHSSQRTELSDSANDPKLDPEESEEDGTMNEFLSRFVWIMRRKLSEVYSDCDKKTIDGMLLIIVGKVVSEMEKGGLEQMLGAVEATASHDFSEDLWKTVWEVSNEVLDDMRKARKKEKMKGFLQSEEVKEMYRFAGEVGIRGEMLREMRFKWAREKMEESEFYQSLERFREEESHFQKEEEAVHKKSETMGEEAVGYDSVVDEEKPEVVSLPKRHGKIRYKIYGLDLSDPKWAEVADKIHETEEVISPQEPKPISGKCKLVTERILSLKEEDNPSPLLAEWVELLQPNRVDWITLLDRLKENDSRLYFKIAELVLGEESFQTNIRDYSKLIEAHAKENRLEDAEGILKKMNEKGILPDILTFTVLVHMYSKAGNLERAKEAFENLRSHGFQPDMRIYNSMIMAYVNAGQPKLGESLMRVMEARDLKPTKEIYMALLRSFAQLGDVGGAQRIATTMQFAGFQPSLESCTLLVEAFGQAGDPDQARSNFDYMIKVGHRPDDRCIASMIAAYEKKNLLDKALNLLLEMEKDGFEPGVATYSVLVDWFGKLQLIDEAEYLLGRIAEEGDTPPLKVHISLCDMYSRAGAEKKALQALGVVEAKKEQLGQEEFERIINGLIAGGFKQDARRMHELMEAQGFGASQALKVALMASQAVGMSQAIGRRRPTMR
ncbi:pentatricopeptide repeat-containing protein At1g05670, mitochondrial [Actinidia eriantha]|uniref:pentatricopeptide repeat-containing protein At1g05670, mitochondrial n=1 Tax=Actinidia eriantha TaxID=165200 RepID=UPI002582FDB6|nr:pentatricopeptide repeat-containing protein At1g05670, mitochondrial [Actinidia eriantha]